jgi:adenylate kinase family enzyme
MLMHIKVHINEKTIKEGLKGFYDTFGPLMDFYRKKGVSSEIKGDDKRGAVIKNIFNILD